ncbi:MAG: hypothetical protein J7K30_15140, partial [Deltaproteobacteria bacterium]|nr:hypothetical protein [Deltaproteobacteria bacterium]
ILHITSKVLYTFFKKINLSVFICVHLCPIVVSKVSTINEGCQNYNEKLATNFVGDYIYLVNTMSWVAGAKPALEF